MWVLGGFLGFFYFLSETGAFNGLLKDLWSLSLSSAFYILGFWVTCGGKSAEKSMESLLAMDLSSLETKQAMQLIRCEVRSQLSEILLM